MNIYYEKNEFEMLDGTKVKAEFGGGRSRYGDYEVDFESVDIDGVELYAELKEPLATDADTFFELQELINRKAEEVGINIEEYFPLFEGWVTNLEYSSYEDNHSDLKWYEV